MRVLIRDGSRHRDFTSRWACSNGGVAGGQAISQCNSTHTRTTLHVIRYPAHTCCRADCTNNSQQGACIPCWHIHVVVARWQLLNRFTISFTVLPCVSGRAGRRARTYPASGSFTVLLPSPASLLQYELGSAYAWGPQLQVPGRQQAQSDTRRRRQAALSLATTPPLRLPPKDESAHLETR